MTLTNFADSILALWAGFLVVSEPHITITYNLPVILANLGIMD